MKSLFDPDIAIIRCEHPAYGWGDVTGGFFVLNNLRIIASSGDGWDHVSVSLPNRCPTWDEMCRVKRLFFHDDECVIQYHPPEEDYVNKNEFVLHMWKPHDIKIPMPPVYMV